MQVVTGTHSKGITVEHACCVGGTWYNECLPAELEATLDCDMAADVVTCEVPRGSVLFLNNITAHRSLPNFSDSVRWSLDLRWQRGGEPNGFSGVKDSVLMVPASAPRVESGCYPVEWGSWADEDRQQAMRDAVKDLEHDLARASDEIGRGDAPIDPSLLDTTISGPWMRRWRLVHHNRHTAQLPAAAQHA